MLLLPAWPIVGAELAALVAVKTQRANKAYAHSERGFARRTARCPLAKPVARALALGLG